MKPPIPLHDARFSYIPARDHDAGSESFKARQLARIKAAQAKPDNNVKPIRKERKA